MALSLVEAFSEIPDPRHARGIRHGVLAIMLLGACAVLTGARSFAAIGEYAHDTGRTILDRLRVGAVVPHSSTIRRVLQDLDPDAVDTAMRTWALAQLAARQESQQLADPSRGRDEGREINAPSDTAPALCPRSRKCRGGPALVSAEH